MNSRYASLAVFLLLVILAAAIGSTFEAGEWYFRLEQPAWTPPPWLFGPVWSVLYLLMAVAAWKVWQTGHRNRLNTLVWWVIQLVMNAGWSWLFFGLERPGWDGRETAPQPRKWQLRKWYDGPPRPSISAQCRRPRRAIVQNLGFQPVEV